MSISKVIYGGLLVKAFETYCRKELAFLSDLEENWQLAWEPPVEVPAVVVQHVLDKAARLGLADLLKKAPKDASLAEAMVFLAEALGACHTTTLTDATLPRGPLTVPEVAKRLRISGRRIAVLQGGPFHSHRCRRLGRLHRESARSRSP
jgi:hypothetical protein